MKLDKLNPWLNFVGNIAILVGLIAVAIEIRDSSTATRAQELGAMTDLNIERNFTMMSPELSSIYVKSLQNPSDLTAAEIWSMNNYYNLRMQVLIRTFRSYQSGILERSDWEISISTAPIFLATPFGRMMWQNLKVDTPNSPEFVSAIDNILATSVRMPDDKWLAVLQSQTANLSPRRESESAVPQ